MKKLAVMFVFSMIFSWMGAQNIRFGVFFNPEISWLSPDSRQVTNDGSILGMNAGIIFDRFFADNYAVNTGISIKSTGGKLKYAEPIDVKVLDETVELPPDATVRYKLQYIEVPLGFKFISNRIGYITFFATPGITSRVNIKATGSSTDNIIDDENISKEINLINMGYYIGAGIEYSLGGSTALIFGLTYTNGFIDVTKRRSEKSNLNNVSLGMGIIF